MKAAQQARILQITGAKGGRSRKPRKTRRRHARTKKRRA
jgi:hypothetical protein